MTSLNKNELRKLRDKAYSGDSEAQFELAISILEKGMPYLPQCEVDEGLELFRISAIQGNTKSEAHLVAILHKITGVPKDILIEEIHTIPTYH